MLNKEQIKEKAINAKEKAEEFIEDNIEVIAGVTLGASCAFVGIIYGYLGGFAKGYNYCEEQKGDVSAWALEEQRKLIFDTLKAANGKTE